MRKWGFILVLTIFVTACTNQQLQDQGENNISINVINDTDFNIYALELTWSQNGFFKGTQGVMFADGSRVKKGESLSFELLETEVNTADEVELIVALLGKQQQQLGSSLPVILKIENNMSYDFELVEDDLKQILLKQIN